MKRRLEGLYVGVFLNKIFHSNRTATRLKDCIYLSYARASLNSFMQREQFVDGEKNGRNHKGTW